MGLGSYLKDKLGLGEELPDTFSSLNVRLNSIIELGISLTFVMSDDDLVMENPGDTLTVTDIGVATVFGLKMYRLYGKSSSGSDYFIQLVETSGGQINDIKLFSQIDEIYPQASVEWDNVFELMNQSEYTIQDGLLFDNAIWTSPVSFEESVTNETESYVYPLKAMLYSRDIAESTSELKEYLAVSVEDDERVGLYVGLDLSVADISVI